MGGDVDGEGWGFVMGLPGGETKVALSRWLPGLPHRVASGRFQQ